MDWNWSSVNWVGILQRVLMAVAILVVTWLVAKLVKKLFVALVERIGFFRRQGAEGKTLGESLGQVASLIVWLFGLVALLQVFELNQVLAPVQGMLAGLLAYLPNVLGAGFVFFVGALIARIVRQLIETALGTVDFDRLLRRTEASAAAATGTGKRNREGDKEVAVASTSGSSGSGGSAGSAGGGAAISRTIATIVYAVIMIVVGIAALQILGISSISDPAQRMLTQLLNAIPGILAALLLLGIGFVIARFAGETLKSILDGFGTDEALRKLEVLPEGRSATPGIARVVQIAVLLFFAVMAAQLLGFPQITAMLNEVLTLGGRVLFGAAIIAAGFWVAGLLARTVGEGWSAQIIRYTTIVLFVAMGLKYMGIADSIIEMAFGAIVIGAAVAAALAFGLGGREAAARVLDRAEERAEEKAEEKRAETAGSTATARP